MIKHSAINCIKAADSCTIPCHQYGLAAPSGSCRRRSRLRSQTGRSQGNGQEPLGKPISTKLEAKVSCLQDNFLEKEKALCAPPKE